MMDQPPAAPPVLVVEDEVLVRMLITDTLTARGFAVFEASSAEEAMPILSARPDIQVMFADINMPGSLDGLQLARAAADLRPELRIMITSGQIDPEASDLPPNARFLPKPFSSQGLIWAIDEVLR